MCNIQKLLIEFVKLSRKGFGAVASRNRNRTKAYRTKEPDDMSIKEESSNEVFCWGYRMLLMSLVF